MKLENFVRLMTGHFDNREQFEAMQKSGKRISLCRAREYGM